MAKLYELVDSYRNLLSLSDDSEGFLAALDTISDAIDNKMENCAKVVKSMLVDVEGLKKEMERIDGRKKSIEGNINRLKDYMHESMKASEKKKIKTPLFTISIVGGKPKLEIEDEEIIPDEYRVDPAPPVPFDKKRILKELKGGKEIDGVSLKTTDDTLQIR